MEFEFDREGPVPIYQQIEAWMRRMIDDGTWPQQSQIPAEQKLAETLNVNRGTLRKAIAGLMQAGLLDRFHGKGTFVAAARLSQPLAESFVTFSENLLERDIAYRTEVRLAEVVPADDRVATLLGIAEGDLAFCLERVRFVHGLPVVVMKNHVRYDLARGIEAVDFTTERLFEVLERDYDLLIDAGQRTFEAMVADAGIAPQLGLKAGAPIMYVQQLSYLKDETPVELSDLWFNGERFRLSAQVKRLRLSHGLREMLVKV